MSTGVNGAAALVQHLDHAETLAGAVDQRHAQHVARAEARRQVDRAVEARIGVGVGNVQHLARAERRADEPGAGRNADLLLLAALGDLRPQLVGRLVVDEKRRALDLEELRSSSA